MADSRFRFRSPLLRVAVSTVLAILLAPAPATAQSPSTQLPFERLFNKAAPADPADGLSADLMYRLLVADIALQRGDPALAARAYYQSARETQNAMLARRATEI